VIVVVDLDGAAFIDNDSDWLAGLAAPVGGHLDSVNWT
jgi:hypothetical protein